MIVIHNQWLPLRGFEALNLFGVVMVRRGAKIDEEVMRHELIHTRQMREMLYLPFYLWYLVEWLIRITWKLLTLPFTPQNERRHHLRDAYAHMLFEREAYRHANDVHYLSHRRHFAWLIESL